MGHLNNTRKGGGDRGRGVKLNETVNILKECPRGQRALIMVQRGGGSLEQH